MEGFTGYGKATILGYRNGAVASGQFLAGSPKPPPEEVVVHMQVP
jgi:hypothetical protein